MGFFSFFSKDKKQEINEEQKKELNEGLQKSKENFFKKLAKSIAGKSKVDDEVLDNLEEVLVTSDVGVETTLKIIDRIEKRVSKDKYLGTNQVNMILKEEIAGLLLENDLEKVNDFVIPEMDVPYIILVVGVNGVGKTTTIGKLAYQYKKHGYSVVLGAADTFRAATCLSWHRRWAPILQPWLTTPSSPPSRTTIRWPSSTPPDVSITRSTS
jgi:fused signal recognition particle receptor